MTTTQQTAQALREARVLQFGEFTLRSGAVSPVYVDLRRLPSFPSAMDAATDALADIAASLSVDAVVGAETAGIPLAAVAAHKLGLPMAYVRKAPKEYGSRSQVEGFLEKGARCVLIDDLITQGGSKFAFLDGLDAAGLHVEHAVVVLDREQGGAEALRRRGRTLHALITLRQLVKEYARAGEISAEKANEVEAYLNANG